MQPDLLGSLRSRGRPIAGGRGVGRMASIATLAMVVSLAPLAPAAQEIQRDVITVRNALTFIADVTVPDGSVMAPGERFTKVWKVRNSGASVWDGHRLAFLEGERMGAADSVAVPTTAPGATVDIAVPMTAPADVGRHRGDWMLRNADGAAVGNALFVLIDVRSPTYAGRTFEEWESELHSQAPAARQQALAALPKFGAKALPLLIGIYRNSRDADERFSAFVGLADIEPVTVPQALTLIQAAGDPDPQFGIAAQMFVLEVLAFRLAPELAGPLLEASRHETMATRSWAIALLNEMGTRAAGAVPVLKEFAQHDPDAAVRQAAATLLERLKVD